MTMFQLPSVDFPTMGARERSPQLEAVGRKGPSHMRALFSHPHNCADPRPSLSYLLESL